MTSITNPGAELRTDHEDEKDHDPKNAPDDSTTMEKESSEAKHEPTMVEPGQEVEHANRKFLQAIVDHWNERENTTFIQDLTPIMDDYIARADGKKA